MEKVQRDAIALYKQGSYDQAQRLFTKCIEIARKEGAPTSKLVALLDQRAASAERAGHVFMALKEGQRMLRYARHDARGYLRVAKCFQIRGDRELAIKAYRDGLKAVPKDDPRYKVLKDQLHALAQKRDQRPSVSTDPIQRLPYDILHQIFSHLSFRCLARLERVSKSWQSFLALDHRLWKNKIDFRNARAGKVTKRMVTKYTSWAINQEDPSSKASVVLSNVKSGDEAGVLTYLGDKMKGKIDSLDAELLSDSFNYQFLHLSPKLSFKSSVFYGLRQLRVNSRAIPHLALLMIMQVPSLESLTWEHVGTSISMDRRVAADITVKFDQWCEKGNYTNLGSLKIIEITESLRLPRATIHNLLKTSRQLKELALEGVIRDWDDLDRQLQDLPLESFSFRQPKGELVAGHIAVPCPGLKRLSLAGVHGILTLAPPQNVKLSALEVLDLSKSSFPVQNAISIYGIGDTLKVLKLDYNSEAGQLNSRHAFQQLVGVSGNGLVSISLEGVSEVNDSTIEGILDCDTNFTLEEVNVSGTRVSGVGAYRLAQHGVKRILCKDCDISPQTSNLLRSMGVLVT
uniref:ARAD1C03564p n=1 Tax=Blastobotrys adeninivorans TaxID=409370 RepID=A0A060T4D4_BLAAD